MKILIINGHPYDKSFSHALADSYFDGAKKGGHEVKLVNLGELKFDPVLRYGYAKRMEIEADWADQQDLIKWCEHLVVVMPIWWGGMPSLLKGYFDRILTPGFAYKWKSSLRWDKLLKGRSARVIYTQGSPQWVTLLVFHDAYWSVIKKSILAFTGFKPVKRIIISRPDKLSEEYRKKWFTKIYNLGFKAK